MKKKMWNEMEAVPNPNPERDYTIDIAVPEFTCVCPRTALPDFGTIRIKYIPDTSIVELKSLKYYMLNYRNLGIFQEAVANRILDDLKELLQPRMIELVADFNPRGGIKAEVTVRWPNSD